MKDRLFKEHPQLCIPRKDNNNMLKVSKKIQLTKRHTKGFANMDKAIDMAYFVCEKLHLFTHPIRYRASLFCYSCVLTSEK
jgi:hypothetical protein